jgi:hypothetical protein
VSAKESHGASANAREITVHAPTERWLPSIRKRPQRGSRARARAGKKRALREAASVVGDTAKDVATEIAAKIIVHAGGMG